MSVLLLENLVTEFDGGDRIGPISLNLDQGQMMALIGPSGSGKTTTLRMIAGLAPIFEGRMSFGATNLTSLPVRHRKVGMVFQNFGLFPHMNVRDNITFGLRMAKRPAGDIEKKLNWILEKTYLTDLSERFSSQLSGGQKQRVALARTLVMDPDILLLDEPLSNLDANLRGEMADFIRNLQQELNITTLFVTHDQEEALMLADQIAVMDKGMVLQQGSAEEVFERPNCLTVAEFLGAGNLFDCKNLDKNIISGDFGQLSLARTPDPIKLTEQGLKVMIRPEHIQISENMDSVPESYNRLTGKITDTRYLGGHSLYKVDVQGKEIIVRHNSYQKFGIAEQVNLVIDPQHIWPVI